MATFDRCRSTTPVVSTKQWLSGNYMGATTTDTASVWDKTGSGPGTTGLLQRMDADIKGRWKGALLRFRWDQLEGATLGDYSLLDNVKSYLDQMDRYNGTKRLILFIQFKTFGTTTNDNVVPLYMRNSATYADPDGHGNGQYTYAAVNANDRSGYVVNMHVNTVRDRFKALMQEMATRFNGHRNLEAIAFSEASIMNPTGATGWNRTPWFNNMTNVFQDMKSRFTNIQICQWINADRADMEWWVPNIRAAGIGLGMPDLCPLEKGFNYRNDLPGHSGTPPGNIQHCQNTNGVAVIMGHASKPVLEGTVVGRCQTSGTIQNQPRVYPDYPGVGTHRQDVRDFAVNTVGVTHLIWAHNNGNQAITGFVDPLIPTRCAQNPFTAYGDYGGKKFNVVTDEFIANDASIITTIDARPNGW